MLVAPVPGVACGCEPEGAKRLGVEVVVVVVAGLKLNLNISHQLTPDHASLSAGSSCSRERFQCLGVVTDIVLVPLAVGLSGVQALA